MSEVAAAGGRFAIVRACDGTYADPVFASHFRDARENGLTTAAYWYVRHPREGTSFAEQAAVVAGQLRLPGVGSLDDGHAPAVWLDVETAPHRLDAGDVVAAADALRAEGVRCAGIYTTRSYWRLRAFPAPGAVPGGLWLAQWPGGASGETEYPGDDHRAWRPFRGRIPDLWQFTDRGTIAGTSVDVDAVRGGEAALPVVSGG